MYNRSPSTTPPNFKLQWLLFVMLIGIENLTISDVRFYSLCACTGRCLRKEAFQVWISWWSDRNISSFETLGKNTKNRISCLKFCVVAVWIYICLDMKYLRIWINKSVWKNWFKMGYVAVILTEVSSLTVSTRTGKNYNISNNYHISAKLTSAIVCWDHFTLTWCVVHTILMNFWNFRFCTHQWTHRHGECTGYCAYSKLFFTDPLLLTMEIYCQKQWIREG